MARQIGHIFITGTIYDVTYYKMYGAYYARMKSTLSRKKVLESPRFENTRRHANQLAEASKIASQLYKEIPKEKRNMPLFRSIVGRAKVLLAQGKDKEVVIEVLKNELFPQEKKTAPKPIKKKKPEERAYITNAGRLIWKTCTKSLKNRISEPQLNSDYFNKDRKMCMIEKENCVYKE